MNEIRRWGSLHQAIVTFLFPKQQQEEPFAIPTNFPFTTYKKKFPFTNQYDNARAQDLISDIRAKTVFR